MKKPSIGRTIYVIYCDEIYQEEVGFIGKDSWIVDDFSDLRCFDSLQYYYDEYNVTWFTSLARAKKALRAKLGLSQNTSFTQPSPGMWVVKEKNS